MSTLKPNRLNSILPVFEEKGLKLPETIAKNEAGLIHVVILTSTPNLETDSFDYSTKIVKTNKESFPTVERELQKENGKVFILHDGSEYQPEAGETETANTVKETGSAAKAEAAEAVKAAAAEAAAAKAEAAEAKNENVSLKEENEKQAEYLGKLEEANDAKDEELKKLQEKLAAAEKKAEEAEKAAKAAAKEAAKK